MADSPLIIIIEDDKKWLGKLSQIINKFFNAELRLISDFPDASEQLYDESLNFDLLITDLLPNENAKRPEGFDFIKFVNTFVKKPVIVVTAEPEFVNEALTEYKVLAAFEKTSFKKLKFIEAISKVIPPRGDLTKTTSENKKSSLDNTGSYEIG
jgi:DNA-binding NtrC family response regulator